jgi:hypothetical protein
MLRLTLMLVLSLFSTQVSATVFMPQPLEKQLHEADGILVGHYLKKESVELENGMVATKMHFQVDKEHGLQTDVFGTNEVIVHYPGGTLSDRAVKVDGVPDFMVGTPVVLMVKNVENRFWGMNLALGTFHVVNYGNDKFLINKLFPTHKGLGQTKYSDFEKMIRKVKGENLKVVYSTIREEDDQPSRSIASTTEEVGNFRKVAATSEKAENDEETSMGQVWWLVGLLAFLGTVSAWRRRHQ